MRNACICGALLLGFAGCNAAPDGYAVSGAITTRPVNTFVDSPLAVRYIETGHPAELGQEEAAARLPECSEESLRSSMLAELSKTFSVDTAAAFAATCLINDNLEINDDYLEAKSIIGAAPPGARGKFLPDLPSYQLVFVPGWNYESARDESGADFRRHRELLARYGADEILVRLDESGAVEDNALTIAQTLDELTDDRPVILISASSGGAAVAHMLGAPDAKAYPQVVGWLNIGGILRGIPYLDPTGSVLRRTGIALAATIKGWPRENLKSMNTVRSNARMKNNRLPDHLTIVNCIAVPLSGDVSPRGTDFYRRMRPFGPNDGLTLITDAIAPGGRTIVALGEDHFFKNDPDQDVMTLALTHTIIRAISEKQGDVFVSDE